MPSPTISYNNIENNTQYNFYWGGNENLSIPYNWWGTTDTQAINQSIYDYKNDFNLVNLTFIPFLHSPNLEAPANSITEPTHLALPTAKATPYHSINPPTPTPSTSPNSAPTCTPSFDHNNPATA